MAALEAGEFSSDLLIDVGSAKLARLSPDGKLLATAKGAALSVRDAVSLEVVCHFSCLDACDALSWSPDSSLVLVFVAKRDCAQVFAPGQPEFRCKVSEGIAGMVACRWAPDSRHVATFADCGLHATFWSLTDQSTLVLPRVKDPAACVAWSPDGSFVACATRKDSKDAMVVVRSGGGFPVLASWPMATHDCASVAWAPDGAALVVADTCLRYLLLVYSARGEELARYCAYGDALGIKALAFSPAPGAFLAVGSYDQSVRLINPLARWQAVHEYPHTHPRLLPARAVCPGVALYAAAPPRLGAETTTGTTFARVAHGGGGGASGGGDPDGNLALLSVAADDSKLAPKVGVGTLAWSHDGRFLATKNDTTPAAAWVWDVSGAGLCCLVSLDKPLRAMKWHPAEHLLAFVCGGAEILFWSPGAGPRALPLPQLLGLGQAPGQATVAPQQAASALQWTADGAALLVATSAVATLVPREAAGEA